MNSLQRRTAQYFGAMRTIKRSGKVIYTARPGVNSDLGLWHDGRRVRQTVNYSTQRKAGMTLLQRVLER